MIRELYQPNLSENERKRISQIGIDQTKRKAFRSCQAIGQCERPIVGGHVIPRSWLKKICDDNGKVCVFSRLPLNPFRWSSEEETNIAIMEHINNAFVGSFTCQKHEALFSSVDNPEPDLSDYRNLNLMVYKPIIASLWQEKLILQSVQAELAEVPESELFQSMLRLQRHRVMGLTHYKRETEQCLHPETCRRCKGGKCKVLGHKVFHIPGEPVVACSSFSDGIRTIINPVSRVVQKIVNWGMTILPITDGHKVIVHHFIEEENIIEPMGRLLSRLQGDKLHREIPHQMLKYFENIAISPMRWDQIGGKRRRAIMDFFIDEMPNVGIGSVDRLDKWERDKFVPDRPIPNPNQINLFNPNKH